MRCKNCGGNANHCKCPMAYQRPSVVFVGPPTECAVDLELEPVLPQAVTKEPEPVVAAIYSYRTFICPACGGKDYLRSRESDVTNCCDEFRVGCQWRGTFPGKWHERQMANRAARIINQVEELQARITTLTSDRDGARRALAGNIEVTERQLKEAAAEIEELRAVLLSIDVKTTDNAITWIFDKPSNEQWASFKKRRDAALKIAPVESSTPASPNLQPGTEADHGPRITP